MNDEWGKKLNSVTPEKSTHTCVHSGQQMVKCPGYMTEKAVSTKWPSNWGHFIAQGLFYLTHVSGCFRLKRLFGGY